MLGTKVDSKDLRTLYVIDKSSQMSTEMMNRELNVTWIIHIYTKRKNGGILTLYHTNIINFK